MSGIALDEISSKMQKFIYQKTHFKKVFSRFMIRIFGIFSSGDVSHPNIEIDAQNARTPVYRSGMSSNEKIHRRCGAEVLPTPNAR